uniref:Uncharacterized protein n=1 Tax=Physcomitrium patens TaxID=3218 RepID=A0A2K1JUP5_PHYPA|nr:hypothetical protein PHYPA_015010 [Physcomitrium patens]
MQPLQGRRSYDLNSKWKSQKLQCRLIRCMVGKFTWPIHSCQSWSSDSVVKVEVKAVKSMMKKSLILEFECEQHEI